MSSTLGSKLTRHRDISSPRDPRFHGRWWFPRVMIAATAALIVMIEYCWFHFSNRGHFYLISYLCARYVARWWISKWPDQFWSQFWSEFKFEQHQLNCSNAPDISSYSEVNSVLCARSCYFWCMNMLSVSMFEKHCSGECPVNSKSETTIWHSYFILSLYSKFHKCDPFILVPFFGGGELNSESWP